MRLPSSARVCSLAFWLIFVVVVSLSSSRAFPADDTAKEDNAILNDEAKPPCQFRQDSKCGCPEFQKPLRVRRSEPDDIFKTDFPDDTELDTENSFEYYVIDDMVFRRNPAPGQADQMVPNQTDQLYLKYWPGGIIFFLIDPEFRTSYRQDVLYAISEIEKNVGKKHLEFREARTKSGRVCRKSYMYIKKVTERMCRAEVGMQTLPPFTRVWLNQDACHKGTIQHEILHALGRYHEQCRPDRDKYLTLVPAEMTSGECPNYYIVLDPDNPSLSVPYDTASIMHYGSCHFSCRGQYTMTRKNGDYISANRETMTKLDVEKMRVLYPQDAKVPYQESMCTGPPPGGVAAEALCGMPLLVQLAFTALHFLIFC